MDATAGGRHDGGKGCIWLLRQFSEPLPTIAGLVQREEPVRLLIWQGQRPPEWQQTRVGRAPATGAAGRRYGWEVTVGRPKDPREYPRTVTVVDPRLLWTLLRAPQDVVVGFELNLATLLAVLSKLRPGRRVLAMIEGDLNLLGATGSARAKVALRRLIARFVDVFNANSPAAVAYLRQTLGVPAHKIVEGWWMAGLSERERPAAPERRVPGPEGPLFVTAGQLIPRKGLDLLLDAVARYRAEIGPCRLRVIGDGPQRDALRAQAERLGLADAVDFTGRLPHEQMTKHLRDADLFVFPTLYDLIGRVVVEAITAGTPVAASTLSGGAGVLIHEGENGVLMDPRDPGSIVDALRRGADPAINATLREGALRTGAGVTPEVAAANIVRAVRLARTPGGASADGG